jgi:hypothetical protein
VAGLICAIHQPNLFPRLSTLAKLFTADVWVSLDDVQFALRDYQHRCRLATVEDPSAWQWLTVPARRPQGRATLINQVQVVDPDLAQRRMGRLIQQYYRRSPHWSAFSGPLADVLAVLDRTDHLAELAHTSTAVLLRLLGWEGRIELSSALHACPGRSERLADLTHRVGARTYLCGTGGANYLNTSAFTSRGIRTALFATPQGRDPLLWTPARQVSALKAMMTVGPVALAEELRDYAGIWRTTTPDHGVGSIRTSRFPKP